MGQSGHDCSFIVRKEGAKEMESMRDVNRVMEREIKREAHQYSLNS